MIIAYFCLWSMIYIENMTLSCQQSKTFKTIHNLFVFVVYISVCKCNISMRR